MTKKDKIHYSFRQVDSFNKKYNFIISPRCLGKSTAMWNKIYKHFRHDGKSSIVVRRQIVDITSAYIDSIEGVINKFLPDDKQIKFAYAKGTIKEGVVDVYIEDKLFIRVIALSNPKSRIKSLFVPDLYAICFDEFIVDTATKEKYLTGEDTKFLELYNTFAREGDKLVKCYFCGNPYSVYTPLWGLINVDTSQIHPGAFIVGKNYVIDCAVPTQELIQWLVDKGMYDPEIDDEYQRYAFEGIAINDQGCNVQVKQPDGYKLKYIFRVQRTYLAVYINGNDERIGSKYWITKTDKSYSRTVYSIDFNNMTNNSILLSIKDRQRLTSLRYSIASNDVLYSSIDLYYIIQYLYQCI